MRSFLVTKRDEHANSNSRLSRIFCNYLAGHRYKHAYFDLTLRELLVHPAGFEARCEELGLTMYQAIVAYVTDILSYILYHIREVDVLRWYLTHVPEVRNQTISDAQTGQLILLDNSARIFEEFPWLIPTEISTTTARDLICTSVGRTHSACPEDRIRIVEFLVYQRNIQLSPEHAEEVMQQVDNSNLIYNSSEIIWLLVQRCGFNESTCKNILRHCAEKCAFRALEYLVNQRPEGTEKVTVDGLMVNSFFPCEEEAEAFVRLVDKVTLAVTIGELCSISMFKYRATRDWVLNKMTITEPQQYAAWGVRAIAAKDWEAFRKLLPDERIAELVSANDWCVCCGKYITCCNIVDWTMEERLNMMRRLVDLWHSIPANAQKPRTTFNRRFQLCSHFGHVDEVFLCNFANAPSVDAILDLYERFIKWGPTNVEHLHKHAWEKYAMLCDTEDWAVAWLTPEYLRWMHSISVCKHAFNNHVFWHWNHCEQDDRLSSLHRHFGWDPIALSQTMVELVEVIDDPRGVSDYFPRSFKYVTPHGHGTHSPTTLCLSHSWTANSAEMMQVIERGLQRHPNDYADLFERTRKSSMIKISHDAFKMIRRMTPPEEFMPDKEAAMADCMYTLKHGSSKNFPTVPHLKELLNYLPHGYDQEWCQVLFEESCKRGKIDLVKFWVDYDPRFLQDLEAMDPLDASDNVCAYFFLFFSDSAAVKKRRK